MDLYSQLFPPKAAAQPQKKKCEKKVSLREMWFREREKGDEEQRCAIGGCQNAGAAPVHTQGVIWRERRSQN